MSPLKEVIIIPRLELMAGLDLASLVTNVKMWKTTSLVLKASEKPDVSNVIDINRLCNSKRLVRVTA